MIKIDFKNEIGAMKPMHGVNCGPLQSYDQRIDYSEKFRESGIPFSRLHDVEYPRGGGSFVDIHCIFKNFDADENDAASYDFFSTDKYIKGIIEAGTSVFYRLGESIDHSERKDFVSPPADNHKWAVICEHIIAHYNEGWANGFHYNIEYWEIWNEPENPPMWTGTMEDYFELYTITANLLKNRFKDSIKVGGYASCGFYALEEEYQDDFFLGIIDYFHKFIEHIKSEKGKAPLDFFSFHIYTKNLERMILHTLYVRQQLDKYELYSTELTLNEWNRCEDYVENQSAHSAAFCAAFMCEAQSLPLDSCMYYDVGHASQYNAVFEYMTNKPLKTYYAFYAFNKLYNLGTQVSCECKCEDIHLCAASDGDKCAVLICNVGDSQKLKIDFQGASDEFEMILLDEKNNMDNPEILVNVNDYVDFPKDSIVLLMGKI